MLILIAFEEAPFYHQIASLPNLSKMHFSGSNWVSDTDYASSEVDVLLLVVDLLVELVEVPDQNGLLKWICKHKIYIKIELIRK